MGEQHLRGKALVVSYEVASYRVYTVLHSIHSVVESATLIIGALYCRTLVFRVIKSMKIDCDDAKLGGN